MYGVLGQFKEQVIISNVTVSNSQIALRSAFLFTMYNLTLDGVHFESSIINGENLGWINS